MRIEVRGSRIEEGGESLFEDRASMKKEDRCSRVDVRGGERRTEGRGLGFQGGPSLEDRGSRGRGSWKEDDRGSRGEEYQDSRIEVRGGRIVLVPRSRIENGGGSRFTETQEAPEANPKKP